MPISILGRGDTSLIVGGQRDIRCPHLICGGPWHSQPAKRILEQLEGEARP
jgi:hypothetical protein